MLQLNRVVTQWNIIDMYRGLWKIEQTFRVTKSEFDARLVFASREDRIQSHFLTCFISLQIVRILEHELDHRHSSKQFISFLKKSNIAELTSTTFKTLYYDRVLQGLKNRMGIEFGMTLYTRSALRKMIAATKKQT